MEKDRLLAFSDGVLAIIITIMVLELRPPHEHTLEGLSHIAPIFSAYVLSFLYVAIYWNNHHHMMQTAERVNGAILWANLHLLFWLSLIPFTTAWLGETGGAVWPTAVYGFDLLCAAIAYYILQTLVVRLERQAFAVRLSRRHRAGVLRALGFASHLRRSSAHLAGAEPKDREGRGGAELVHSARQRPRCRQRALETVSQNVSARGRSSSPTAV
jgi:uncharacterized membrane protein